MHLQEPSRRITFEPDNDHYEQPSGVTIIEPSDGAMTLQPWELIQENRYVPDNNGSIEIHESQHESTLTVDEILRDFSHALSYENGSKLINELLDTVPGSQTFEAARQKAKIEITLHHLWRMGLPSELSHFLDIDNPETRTLLVEEYAKIPEDTKRDNSANSFKLRLDRVLAHIHEEYSKEEVQDLLDIWQEDLRIRQEIVKGGTPHDEAAPIEIQRNHFLKRYLEAKHDMQNMVSLIGNTLLWSSQEEVQAFKNSIDRLLLDTVNAEHASRLHILCNFVDTEFIQQKIQSPRSG